MKKNFLPIFGFLAIAQLSYAAATVEDICNYINDRLGFQINNGETGNICIDTYKILGNLFTKYNIRDYADVYGKKGIEELFDEDTKKPLEIAQYLGEFFIKNQSPTYPETQKKYDYIIVNTSGINVFVERFALIVDMYKKGLLDIDHIVMLVGMHKHRKDLQNVEYLLQMVRLFPQFNLDNMDEISIRNYLESMVNEPWTHRIGAMVAFELLKSDPNVLELFKKFEFFTVENPEARTEELLSAFVKEKLSGLDNPSIAFLCNGQGYPKTEQMVENQNFNFNPDFLVTGSLDDEVERKLHKDTDLQRALIRLFHFYRLLEAKYNN